jgi:hypothetical protein
MKLLQLVMHLLMLLVMPWVQPKASAASIQAVWVVMNLV